jgi:energy-converting hydrogenase Eha subunit C
MLPNPRSVTARSIVGIVALNDPLKGINSMTVNNGVLSTAVIACRYFDLAIKATTKIIPQNFNKESRIKIMVALFQ